MSGLAQALGVTGGIVCAVGAGGKKSLLYALARVAQGRVGLTATVATAPFPRRLQAQVLIAPQADLAAQVPALAGPGITAYACPSHKPKRLAGLDPDMVARLHREAGFDLSLVKADGARMRGIKAPKPGEPVIVPGSARVLVVVSAAVLGAPLDERVAHRPERVAQVAGGQPGQVITPELVGRLLVSRDGGLQGCEGIPVTLVINQVDDRARADLAAQVAQWVLDTGGGPVVLTCLRAAEPVVAVFRRRC